MRRTIWAIIAGLALWGAVAATVSAQQPRRSEEFFQRAQFFDRETRARLEAVTPAQQKALVEWGGFYLPSYQQFTDINGHTGHVTSQDFRLWTQIKVDEVHTVFARMRMNYIDFASGDAQGGRAHDLEGPNLEMGFYELDISAAAKKYAKQEWPMRLTARGGRQYIEVGRGIALGKILDAGRFDVDTRDFSFMGFAGRTEPGENNIDLSAPDFSHSRRSFYGGQLKYTRLEKHEPFAYFVIQRDWSDEDPENPRQDFRYSSNYEGVGSRGELARNLRYELESIWEFGRSSPNAVEDATDPIRAYAFDAEVDYYVQHALKPVLAAEYGYASGDGDRQSATTAQFGNRHGTHDDAFQGFGYINTGLALAARFTNLQFVRLGSRITPYEKKTAFGRLDVGADYYRLFKADDKGPISDFRANQNSADIGQEVDVFLEWRLFSDLSLSVRYAHFFPGNAYHGGQDPQDFLYTALNFSF